MREDHEDLTRQRDALEDARQALRTTLSDLAQAAGDFAQEARLVAKRKKITPKDLDGLYAEGRATERAEEAVRSAEAAVDAATYDLHTAAGGDG